MSGGGGFIVNGTLNLDESRLLIQTVDLTSESATVKLKRRRTISDDQIDLVSCGSRSRSRSRSCSEVSHEEEEEEEEEEGRSHEDDDEIQLLTIRPKSKSRLVTRQASGFAKDDEAEIIAEKEEFVNLDEKTGYIKVLRTYIYQKRQKFSVQLYRT